MFNLLVWCGVVWSGLIWSGMSVCMCGFNFQSVSKQVTKYLVEILPHLKRSTETNHTPGGRGRLSKLLDNKNIVMALLQCKSVVGMPTFSPSA